MSGKISMREVRGEADERGTKEQKRGERPEEGTAEGSRVALVYMHLELS